MAGSSERYCGLALNSPLHPLMRFAVGRGFLAASDELPIRDILDISLQVGGKHRPLKNVPSERIIRLLEAYQFKPMRVGPGGAAAEIPAAELSNITVRPRIAIAQSEVRFPQILALFRRGGDVPTYDNVMVWTQSTVTPVHLQELSTADRAIRTTFLKWFDPATRAATRARKPGFDEAFARYKLLIREAQQRVTNARVAYKSVVKEYNNVLIARDTALRRLDPNRAGMTKLPGK